MSAAAFNPCAISISISIPTTRYISSYSSAIASRISAALCPRCSSSSRPFLSNFRDTNSRPRGALRPLSSLRETQKRESAGKVPNAPPRISSDKLRVGPHSDDLQKSDRSNSEAGDKANETQGIFGGDTALKGTLLAGLLLVGVVGGFGGIGYVYRDQINSFLVQFSDILEGYGPAGYALFIAVYAALEILAIPAIPLTMSAGLLFGNVTGTVIVSISGTIAATASFLIARYFARERIMKLVEGNKKFLAIDKAIGENGFRVVTLLRLSPLLPFSLGNYLYGLTSVKLLPYVIGSWLGMLPGTWAYVSAGALGRAFIQEEAGVSSGGNEQLLTLGVGLLATIIAATYVGKLAKDAVKDLEE